MVKLKKALTNKKLIIKYILISLFSYAFVFIGLYLFINLFSTNKKLSFVIIYGFAYLLLYGVQLKFLFYKKHDSFKLIRYILSILFFYITANIIYFIGLKIGLHYFLSSALAILILMPLRFLVYNFYVYKN